MQRDETKAERAAIEYQPSVKRPRGRSRKQWFDWISQDIRSLDADD